MGNKQKSVLLFFVVIVVLAYITARYSQNLLESLFRPVPGGLFGGGSGSIEGFLISFSFLLPLLLIYFSVKKRYIYLILLGVLITLLSFGARVGGLLVLGLGAIVAGIIVAQGILLIKNTFFKS